MATIVLASIGNSVGNNLLPGLGGRILGGYGRRLGRWADDALGLGPDAEAKEGPRLENLKVQDSRYGLGIPLAFGRVRVAGNIIWLSDLMETSHETSTGGGKGGGSSSSRTTYSYSVHCAVAVCTGEIAGLATIWADSKIIYQNGVWKSGTVNAGTIYNGSKNQNADPLMESLIGRGNVPAYRGIAYIVFDNLQLGDFGNRLPNLTFEVLPAGSSGQPSWMGSVSSGINHRVSVVQNKGMSPIITQGRSGRARRMLVGGYFCSGDACSFNVVEYDVAGDELFEVDGAQSESFYAGYPDDHSWAMSPDGRFVAMYMQSSVSAYPHRFVLYDLKTRKFGSVFADNIGANDGMRQIVWIDSLHFLVSATLGGKRGVYVYARAGTTMVSLGFFDVWGVNSGSTRFPLMYAQFVPMSNGLLNVMTDSAPFFTSLYARHILWQNGVLEAGSEYVLASGLSVGSGSGPQCSLLRTSHDEWTLFYSTVVDMRMMSLRPGDSSAIITRPWQIVANANVSVSTSTHPVVIGNRIVVVQRSASDNYYRISEITLDDGKFTLISDSLPAENFTQPCINFGAASIDAVRLLVLGVSGFYDSLGQIGVIKRCHTGDTLGRIVGTLLERSGFADGDYDVEALNDIPVDGYIVPDASSASAAIASLQIYEPFDLVESGDVLKAVLRTYDADAAVPKSERGASENRDEPVPLCETTRVQEVDLPLEIKIDHIEASRDYETGSQRARRTPQRGARVKSKIDLPIVCTAAKAKQIAEMRLYALWSEREHARFTLSRKWLGLEPGDVVNLGKEHLRVENIRLNKGVLDVKGVLVPLAPRTSHAKTDSHSASYSEAIEAASSTLFLMDMPLLRDSDDQPGIYAAVTGPEAWPGATLWRSSDDINYGKISQFKTAATAGVAVSKIESGHSCYPDMVNTVKVQLLRGLLYSCGDDELLRGANLALLGDEIVQFKSAVLLGPGLYELSHFLRGRCGTENHIEDHVIGERFVVLKEISIQFLPAPLTDRGRTCYFRALSHGQSLNEANRHSIAYDFGTLRPLAPVHIEGSRIAGAGSDLTIRWKRRARNNAAWVDYMDVPLDEASELYAAEIMNGTSIVRMFEGLTSPTLIYTAEQQAADWGGQVPPQVKVCVYQISARYGRGQKAKAVI